MASASPVGPEPRSAWPPVVDGLLHRRRRALGSVARGRVLDLGWAGPPLDSFQPGQVDSITVVEADGERARWLSRRAEQLGLELVVIDSLEQVETTGGSRFDTVVSVLGLVRQADLPGALASVVALMHPGGSLLLLEPTLSPATTTMVLTPLAGLLPTVAPLHLNRDVPSAVRAHGLTVIAIERFTMPTLIWPLRPFVQATARRILASPAAPTAHEMVSGSPAA